MNKVTLIGHLCQDSERNTTQDGRPYLKFRMAVNHRVKGQNAAMFVTVFYPTKSENISQYLTKGRQIYVEGTFTLATYTDRNNQVVPAMTVNAYAVELLGSTERQNAQATQQNNTNNNKPYDDGLPF